MRIAVIGGGPVGLMAAVFARQKGLEVTVFEKRRAYRRAQIVMFSRRVQALMPVELRRALWGPGRPGCYMAAPRTSRHSRCYGEPVGSGDAAIPLATFERTARACVEALGVRFEEREQDGDVEGFDAVLAADGSRSKWAERMGAHRNDVTVSHGVGIIAQHRGEHVNASVSNGLAGAQNVYRAFPSPTGRSYLGMQVGEAEYEASRGAATFERLPASLRSAVESRYGWDFTGAEVFAFEVRVGWTSPAVARVRGVPVLLVGDSLCRTHFFSGAGVNLGVTAAWTAIELLSSGREVEYDRAILPEIRTAIQQSLEVALA